ncbi:MAG TPA: serine hydrolase domain-containing protein, partial [Pseudonocardiaceae bacterium]|nr:serine hydrolase domain-containing protein [Pseudonocardiaceae bacterium]
DSEIRIGSATKTFVATVILQLVAERRLSLDDTVDHWLPGLVTGNGNDGSKITIRELLQHTSGIADFTDDMAQLFATPQGYYQHRLSTVSPGQLVGMALRHPPLFPPGDGWSYSGTNYVLLGMIIKQVTGKDWAQEVTDRIIGPLGLSHTYLPGTSPGLASPHADLYQQFDPGGPLIDTTVFNMTWADAAGAIVSTSDDLDRFFRALVGGQLLPSAQLAAMEQTVPTPGQLSFSSYGLGLGWQGLPCGGGYWTHDGDVFGSSTIDGITPDGKHTVVVETFTELAGDGPAIAQRQAGYQLLDNALCQLSR